MFTVTITNMQTAKEQVKEFAKYKDAFNFYALKCDELGYDYSANVSTQLPQAGGLGHDYRLRIEEQGEGLSQGYNEELKGWVALFKDEKNYLDFLKWQSNLES